MNISDLCRRHQLFVSMIAEHVGGPEVLSAPAPLYSHLGRAPNRPTDMPIYSKEFMKVEKTFQAAV